MVCVGEVSAPIHSAVLDERSPSGGYKYMVDGLFCDTVITDPCPVVDPFPWEPSVGNRHLGGSAQVNQAVAIVIRGSVNEHRACYIRESWVPCVGCDGGSRQSER